jgi:DNA-binding NtrC family response regulator
MNKNAKAILIDDNPDSIELLEMVLTHSGFKVKKFYNFADSLKALTNEPCVIFSDYRVPGDISFDEFVSETRRRFPHMRIVLMTGDWMAKSKVQQLNINGWLFKPFDIDDFVNMAKEHCFV